MSLFASSPPESRGNSPSRASTPPSERLKNVEERLTRLTRTLQPVFGDRRWELPPEPVPREPPKLLNPQYREFRVVRALDDVVLPDPEAVRARQARPVFQPGREVEMRDVILSAAAKILADNPNKGFGGALRQWAVRPPQEECLINLFWWFVADFKRRDMSSAEIKAVVFELYSDHFVECVMPCHDVTPTYRDQLQKHWIRLCAEVVFSLCHLCFPNSAYRFNEDFRRSVEETVRHWSTGFLPSEIYRARAILAEQAKNEREHGSGNPSTTSAATMPALGNKVNRRSSIADGATALTAALGGHKSLFDPFQRSPALRGYLERHGVVRALDREDLSPQAESLIRPRDQRRLGQSLKLVRAGPTKETIDKIEFNDLAARALSVTDTSAGPVAPSDAAVAQYSEVSRATNREVLKARKKLVDGTHKLERESEKARLSPSRVRRITTQMVGRIKMEDSPASKGPGAASLAEAARQDDKHGQLLRDMGSRRMSRAGGPVPPPPDSADDPDSLVSGEVAERQALLRTLQDVQHKAKEKKLKARETLKRILHEKEEVFEGLEAIVTQPIHWLRPKDSRDLEAGFRAGAAVRPGSMAAAAGAGAPGVGRVHMRRPSPEAKFGPQSYVTIQRDAKQVLRGLQNDGYLSGEGLRY